MLLLPRQVAAAGRHVAVAAAIEHRDDAFGRVEVGDLLPERRGVAAAPAAAASPAAPAPASSPLRRVHLSSIRRMIGPSSMRTRARRLRQHDLAGELAAIFREVGLVRDLHADDVGGDGALRARRPLLREADERLHLRLDQVRAEAHERPAFAEPPALLVDVGQPPLGELLHRPLAGLLNRRRAGEPRAVDVAEPRDVIHHLRAIQAFVADAADGRVIDLLGLRAAIGALAATGDTSDAPLWFPRAASARRLISPSVHCGFRLARKPRRLRGNRRSVAHLDQVGVVARAEAALRQDAADHFLGRAERQRRVRGDLGAQVAHRRVDLVGRHEPRSRARAPALRRA